MDHHSRLKLKWPIIPSYSDNQLPSRPIYLVPLLSNSNHSSKPSKLALFSHNRPLFRPHPSHLQNSRTPVLSYLVRINRRRVLSNNSGNLLSSSLRNNRRRVLSSSSGNLPLYSPRNNRQRVLSNSSGNLPSYSLCNNRQRVLPNNSCNLPPCSLNQRVFCSHRLQVPTPSGKVCYFLSQLESWPLPLGGMQLVAYRVSRRLGRRSLLDLVSQSFPMLSSRRHSHL